MWEAISKLRLPLAAFLAGCLLLMPAMMTGLSVVNFSPEPREVPNFWALATAMCLIAASVVMFLMEEGFISSTVGSGLQRIDSGFSACLGRQKINILFDRIENVARSDGVRDGIVVLPVNDTLGVDCLKHRGTSCAEFFAATAGSDLVAISDQIIAERTSLAITKLGNPEVPERFDIGSCILLKNPNGSAFPVLLVAATTKTNDAGYRSDIANISICMRSVADIAMEAGFSRVFMPVIGSGKGSLTAEAALLAILLSVSALQQKIGGLHNELNIIVYQANKKSAPSVRRRDVAALLRLVTRLHGRHSGTA